MNKPDRRVKAAASAVAAMLALSACRSPDIYNQNLTQLDFSGKQRPASIVVSDAKLFQRHALINERRNELDYLNRQLTASETVTFSADIARDIETISAMSAALGVSFDAGAKQKARFLDETNAIKQEIVVERLRGDLAQTQRDVELLKAKLADQKEPSSTPVTAATAALDATATPAVNTNKETAAALSALITSVLAQIDRSASGPRMTGSTGAPRDIFADRQAYRRELQASINAVSLDALHDIGPNSMFRLQIDAAVLPGEANSELGVLDVDLVRPAYAGARVRKEIEPLYFQWMDHATNALNPPQGKLVDQGIMQLALEGRMLTLIAINVGELTDVPAPAPGNGTVQKPAIRESGLVTGNGATYSLIRPLTNWIPTGSGLTSPAPASAPASASAPEPATPPATRCQVGIEPDGLAPSACPRVLVPFPPIYDAAKLQLLTQVVNDKALADRMESLVNVLQSLPDGARQRHACVAALRRTAGSDLPRVLPNKAGLQRLQRITTWALVALPDTARAPDSPLYDMATGARRLLGATDALQRHAVRLGCGDDLMIYLGATTAGLVPDAFIRALFIEADDRWTARGRLSTYAVTPQALMQRVSTAARAADAVQLAASLAAALPVQGIGLGFSGGYMKSVAGKTDALERIPLVVGYSSFADFDAVDSIDRRETRSPRFGWVLGPNVVIDPARNALALEHKLSPYDLTADISMPGWWPHIQLVSRAAWAPDWKAGRGIVLDTPDSRGAALVVPIRHTAADMDGLTQMLLNAEHADEIGGSNSLHLASARIGDIQPGTVADCAGETTFLIKGAFLWRASAAFLEGVPASSINVMPDMQGVMVTFDISKIQPGLKSANLVIPTPDGSAIGSVPIRGKRSDASSCGAPAADDGLPSISAVVPDHVSACEGNAHLVVRGRHLDKINSVWLGTAGVTINVRNEGLLELLLDKPLSEGAGGELPLVLSTDQPDAKAPRTGPAAVTSVRLWRGACGAAGSGASARLRVANAPLDMCAASGTLQLVGAAAPYLVSATLASTSLKFTLAAKSVRVNAANQTADVEFVGLPSKAVASPADLAAPLNLELKTRSKVIHLDVPAVCGSYK